MDDEKAKMMIKNVRGMKGIMKELKNMKGTKVSESDEKVIIKTKREQKERYRE
jgi:hypothetical protein